MDSDMSGVIIANSVAALAVILSGFSLYISHGTNKKNMYYRLLDDRNKIYEAISDFVEYNYEYSGCGSDIWECFEEGPDDIQDELYYRDEEKLIFDNLRKAHQYFPKRKKEIQRVKDLLEEYRKLHIQRAYDYFEGQAELYESEGAHAERDSLINNLREKVLERIKVIRRTLNLEFYQLLKELKKDIY